jgi:hypothetical protein
MELELGSLVPALAGWRLCIDEDAGDCTITVRLPKAVQLDDRGRVYVALYIAARHVMDYRLAAALHIYSVRSRIVVHPSVIKRIMEEAIVESRVPRRIVDDCPYAWDAVYYRGVAYAQAILDLDRMIPVKVEPPRDKRERERLRALLEGKRVLVNDRTYHTRGLVERLGGKRLAPWVYLIPKRGLPRLRDRVEGAGGRVLLVAVEAGGYLSLKALAGGKL